MAKRGKKYTEAKKLVDVERDYTIAEACDLVKRTAVANFDESVDLDLRLGVDPQHADQMVRGTVTLPHGTGQEISVLALVSESYQEEAVEAGADHVGLDDYIEKIEEENWTDVDVIIATPDVMGKIGKLGRILGPRGLMPNPKSGTVTTDVGKAVEESKAGKIEFRVDRYGQLHTTIGKVSFDANELRENAIAFIKEVNRLRPASAKGLYMKRVHMSSTMGPSISIDRSAAISL